MRADLIPRLKAFGATAAGIKAIAELGLSDDAIEERLKEEEARALGVRYKVTKEQDMPPKSSMTVAAAADHFENTLKAARIPELLHDGLWDVWVADPARAQRLVTRFKDTGTAIGQQVAAKLKQSALDPVEAAGARFIAALRAKLPDDAAIAYLDQQTQALQGASGGSARATVTSSGDQSVTTKADAWRDWTPGDMAPR